MTQITASLVKTLREKSGAGMMDCKKALVENSGDIELAMDWLRKKGMGAAAKKAGRSASEGLVAIYSDDNKAIAIELNSETDFVSRNEQFQSIVSEIVKTSFSSFDSVSDINSVKSLSIGDKTVESKITEAIATIGENMELRRVAKCESSTGIVATYIHNATAEGMGKIAVALSLESTGDKAKLKEIGKSIAMHVAAARPEFLNVSDIPAENIEKEKAIFADQARSSGKPDSIIEKMIGGRIKKYQGEIALVEQQFVKDNKLTINEFVDASAKEIGAEIKISSFIRLELGEGVEKEEADFASEVASMTK